MNITITGASGFVGQNLKLYLNDSHQLNTLSVRYIANQKFQIDSDAIIHLAGKAHDLKKVSTLEDYYIANFELTKQLFDAFLESEMKVFIFMSTVKAVADSIEGTLTEETIPNPITPYGIAKYQAEVYILSKEIPPNKRVFILRPCMIHGSGNKGNLNLLYNFVSKGLPWPLGSFENNRSFLSIENLCFVIKNLLEDETIISGVYQVADDKPLSTNELIKILDKSLNKKTLILNIPQLFIIAVAKFGDILHLSLNNERLQKLTEDYVVSNHKIKSVINKSLPVSSEEGLLKTFQSFKK